MPRPFRFPTEIVAPFYERTRRLCGVCQDNIPASRGDSRTCGADCEREAASPTSPPSPSIPRPALALCERCVSRIGGAFGGPDAEWRSTLWGEPCGALDCDAATTETTKGGG